MFQRTPNVIVEKAGDGENSKCVQMIATLMPWTQWIGRVYVYIFGELYYYAWNDGWFGRMIKAKVWQEARQQIKSEKLAKEILFDENKIVWCKRIGIYTQFYR